LKIRFTPPKTLSDRPPYPLQQFALHTCSVCGVSAFTFFIGPPFCSLLSPPFFNARCLVSMSFFFPSVPFSPNTKDQTDIVFPFSNLLRFSPLACSTCPCVKIFFWQSSSHHLFPFFGLRAPWAEAASSAGLSCFSLFLHAFLFSPLYAVSPHVLPPSLWDYSFRSPLRRWFAFFFSSVFLASFLCFDVFHSNWYIPPHLRVPSFSGFPFCPLPVKLFLPFCFLAQSFPRLPWGTPWHFFFSWLFFFPRIDPSVLELPIFSSFFLLHSSWFFVPNDFCCYMPLPAPLHHFVRAFLHAFLVLVCVFFQLVNHKFFSWAHSFFWRLSVFFFFFFLLRFALRRFFPLRSGAMDCFRRRFFLKNPLFFVGLRCVSFVAPPPRSLLNLLYLLPTFFGFAATFHTQGGRFSPSTLLFCAPTSVKLIVEVRPAFHPRGILSFFFFSFVCVVEKLLPFPILVFPLLLRFS